MTYHDIKQFIPLYHAWDDNPEPDIPELDPRVILDTNMESTAWMYNVHETSAWFCYKGELMPLEP